MTRAKAYLFCGVELRALEIDEGPLVNLKTEAERIVARVPGVEMRWRPDDVELFPHNAYCPSTEVSREKFRLPFISR